jgi:hypothetical protein
MTTNINILKEDIKEKELLCLNNGYPKDFYMDSYILNITNKPKVIKTTENYSTFFGSTGMKIYNFSRFNITSESKFNIAICTKDGYYHFNCSNVFELYISNEEDKYSPIYIINVDNVKHIIPNYNNMIIGINTQLFEEIIITESVDTKCF